MRGFWGKFRANTVSRPEDTRCPVYRRQGAGGGTFTDDCCRGCSTPPDAAGNGRRFILGLRRRRQTCRPRDLTRITRITRTFLTEKEDTLGILRRQPAAFSGEPSPICDRGDLRMPETVTGFDHIGARADGLVRRSTGRLFGGQRLDIADIVEGLALAQEPNAIVLC